MVVTKILPTLLFQSIFGNFYDCSFVQIVLIHAHNVFLRCFEGPKRSLKLLQWSLKI